MSVIKQLHNKISCSYCLRDISNKKIALHERLCLTLMSKCSQCNEVLPTEEIVEHIQNYHSIQNTHSQKISSTEKSKRICIPQSIGEVKDKRFCKYCDLDFFDTKELLEHENYCGSKSEKCCLCDMLIPKKYYTEHLTQQCLNNSAIKSKNKKRDRHSFEKTHSSKKGLNIKHKLMNLDKEIENNKTELSERTSEIAQIKTTLFNCNVIKNQIKRTEPRNNMIEKYLTKKRLR